jgi:hypothetical protein
MLAAARVGVGVVEVNEAERHERLVALCVQVNAQLLVWEDLSREPVAVPIVDPSLGSKSLLGAPAERVVLGAPWDAIRSLDRDQAV